MASLVMENRSQAMRRMASSRSRRSRLSGVDHTSSWRISCVSISPLPSVSYHALTEHSIWCIYFVSAMQQNMSFNLSPYVTSEFYAHSLTAATGIMSSIIGGLWQLPLAKILDIWGRPQGFALMVCSLTIGLIMMAACQNVQTYAAAQVFYWVG